MKMQILAQEKRKCGGQTSAGVDFFPPPTSPPSLRRLLLNFNGEASKQMVQPSKEVGAAEPRASERRSPALHHRALVDGRRQNRSFAAPHRLPVDRELYRRAGGCRSGLVGLRGALPRDPALHPHP